MDAVHSPNGDFLWVGWPNPNAGRPVCRSVSQSVSQYVCPRTSVNSSGSAEPIRTGPTPKDAPEIGNDDGGGHVAPRVTCDPPRADT